MTKQEVLDAANVMIAYANGKKVGTRPRRSMEPLLKILYVPTWNWEQKDYCIIPDHAAKESLEQSQGGQAVSDTPISDSTAHNIAELGMLCRRLERLASVRLAYIQQLETENDAMRADLLLWGDNLRLQQRINRLEEENDALRADLLLWNEKESK